MTLVATDGPAPLAFGVVNNEDPELTVPRNIRFLNRVWFAFEAIVGKRGKSYWVSSFVESVVAEPELWREVEAIAKVRGETLADALTAGARAYRAAEKKTG